MLFCVQLVPRAFCVFVASFWTNNDRFQCCEADSLTHGPGAVRVALTCEWVTPALWEKRHKRNGSAKPRRPPSRFTLGTLTGAKLCELWCVSCGDMSPKGRQGKVTLSTALGWTICPALFCSRSSAAWPISTQENPVPMLTTRHRFRSPKAVSTGQNTT